MSDLSARLRAVVEERLAVAHGATPGPWETWHDLDAQGFYTVGEASGVIPDGEVWVDGLHNPTAHVYVIEDTKFIALNDPADVIRACERDLAVLERHAPREAIQHDAGVICRVCMYGQGEDMPWPCDEITDMATRYRVEVDG